MSWSDDYFKLVEEEKKKKKKKEEAPETFETSPYSAMGRLARASSTHSTEDVYKQAVKTVTESKRTKKDEEEEERKWFQKGAFEDGYQFGDVLRTIEGTTTDIRENAIAGVLGIGEAAVDAGAYIAGGVGKLFGADDFADKTKKFISKELIDEEKIAKVIVNATSPGLRTFTGDDTDDISVLGEKTDSLMQSGGQLLGTVGLQAVGVPWFVTSGVTSFGSEAENAFNQGASYGEAGLSATISAGAEILTEKLFGGSGLGEKGLINLDGLTKGISNKLVKVLADHGVDMAAEGFEEIFSQVAGNLGSALYREENLEEILLSEEALDGYLESFIGGAALGGVANVGKAANSIQTGRDYRTGMTESEQKVFDKVYEDAVKEAEQDGKKLTSKEKAKIYDEIVEQMEKGYIGTDIIEEVLGGETYKTYRDTVDSEEAILKEYEELGKKQNATLAETARYNELSQQVKDIRENSKRNEFKTKLGEEVFGLVKNDRLSESYAERSRRGQAFEADLTQYDAKQQQTIQKAIDSGILNNTRRTHEFVDMVAKITADKGVLFDFTNNEKLKNSGFGVDGKFVNGYVTKDGITVNVNSSKSLNSIVGHEITHVLEGTDVYTELQSAIVEYAKSKGDYQGRYDALSKLYKDIEGANIDAELTADLVGDYLFTDQDFINNLSVKNRNVFQKIYDEVKYLCKVATAGSKEAKELAKVQRAFEKAYQEAGKAAKDTKYSVGYHAGDLGKAETFGEQGYYRGTGHFGTGTYFVGDEAQISDSHYGKRPHHSVEMDNYNLYKVRSDKDGYEMHDQLRVIDGGFSQEFLEAAKANKFKVSELRHKAWELADKYDTQVWNEELEMYLSNDYIGSSIRAYTEVANENGVDVQSYDEWLDEQGGDPVKPGDDEYEYYKTDYLDYLKETLSEADSERNGGYEKFRDAYFGLRLRFGRDKVNRALQAVIEHEAVMRPGGENDYKAQEGADSLATVFMKSLGYEGVNVSGTALDNTTYGSVIYDLKGEDLARKKEIGTAKYSLSDSDGKQLTKGQQEYFKDSKMRDEKGNLKVMYHGSQDAGFHVFDPGMSDDDTSLFFVDRNDVAASYSGTTETYEAKTIRSAEDMNKFLAEIGQDEDYSVTEKDGQFILLYDGERVAASDTAQGIYKEFCWYEGVGEGDANYKVYLNLTNPLEVDADGRYWNAVNFKTPNETIRFEVENVKGRWKIKDNLNGDYLEIDRSVAWHKEEYAQEALDDYLKNHPREQTVVKTVLNKTRDIAGYAKAEGYDGVIFKNIVDIGGYGGEYTPSTVAIAFDSNQVKSTANEMPTKDADIRYSLSDAEGRQLTKEQAAYFKDSKVRDENGSLKVMYHGTPNGDFTVFKDGTYFTDNKEYADKYQNPGASSLSTKKSAYNPKTYQVYLDIKKPFDINDAEARRVYIEDYIKGGNAIGINPYLSDAEYAKIKTIDWTEGEDLREFLIDNGYDYDGLVLDEGATGGYGDEVKSRGTSYVVFSPEQVKNIDNRNPSADPDIRFSLSEAVEETKELMAIHNLSEEKLLKSLRLGGLPMPSVAIAKAKDGHGEFGEISLILPKEAIDPKASRKNKLYSGDAWTPTYPSVEYKVDTKVLKKIRDKVHGLVPYEIRHELGSVDLDADDMEKSLNRWGGNAVVAFSNDDAMKYAYLLDIGADISLPMKEKNLSYHGKRENGAIIRVAEAISAEDINKALNGGSEEAYKLEPVVRKAVAEYMQERLGHDPEVLEVMMPDGELSYSELDGYLVEARKYHRTGIEQTVDRYEARDAIRKMVNQDEYNAWVEELFSGIIEKEGIRNKQDYFTPSGNRRSFEALHYEHNLENVIKAMREKGEKGIGTFGGSIFGASTTEFSSIAEMKRSGDRLQMMSEEEYQAMRDQFHNRFFEIAGRLPNDTKSFMAMDDAANVLIEAVSKYNTKAGIANYLQRELKGWATYSEQVVDDLIALVNDIRNMPTGYFEAKPQRAVGFDEVGVFIIPYDASAKLKQELLNGGYAIAEYDPKVDGDRTRVLNQFEEYKFSLSDVGQQHKQYRGNFYGKDILLESEDIAPVSEEVNTKVNTEVKNATRNASADEMEAVAPVAEMFPDNYAPTVEEEEAWQAERMDSLMSEDAPPEVEAPYYGESEPASAEDPFDDRDWYDVGKRNVKAYMYENPEVKPFFQEMAGILQWDLADTTKAEKWYNDQLYYESGGEEGFGGNKRHTSRQIETMLDEWNMSYADIEKGLKAIIEDHGAENISAAKKIEFMLNDMLRNGYMDFHTGKMVEPNQEYIDTLNEIAADAYSKESFDALMAEVDPGEYAPIAEKYEAIKPKPQKRSTEPRMVRADSKGEERRWYKTSTGSDAVDGKVTPDDIPDELRYYQPIPNKKTLGNANSYLAQKGYDKALAHFNEQLESKKVSLDDIALGERLIQEAIKKGDTKTASELIQNVAILGTELGQKVQALSIIKKLTPEGQLMMLQKTVDRGKTKGDKAFEGVELTQEMKDKILSAYKSDGSFDQMYLSRMVEDVKQQIADQMKVTAWDKINAWRYLSMLGNPKTHIRNVVSNVAMYGTRQVKNAIARTIEDIAPIEGRTKTWKQATDAVKAFSERMLKEMDSDISGDKYSDSGSIKAKRKIFNTKAIEWASTKNSDLLSAEDAFFSKPAFKSALSEFLTANGIKTEADIKKNPELVAKAKQYAMEQAKEATFQQDSYLANKIGEIERKNAGYGMLIGSVLPFKKTPINIAKAGLSYSPLGIARNIYDMVQVKKGNMDASEAIDHVAQTLTGSSLALVGYMLAQAGILNGAGDDDKEGEYDYQLGKQAYSLNFFGDTFSLSWLSPVAMPLFVGANAYEQLVEGKEWNADVVAETLAQTLDPLSEMSFLSSLDSVLSSYDSGIQKFMGIFETAGQNYITQFVPTLSSQFAAVFDPTKRSTKVAADSDFKFGDRVLNQIKYKIPGLRNTLEPSTDIWGNENKQTEIGPLRAAESFLAPWSKRENITSAVDEEIKDLYSQVGDGSVIPGIPSNTINYDGVKYEMSAKEHTAFKQAYGQLAYDTLEDLFNTDTYRNADAETRRDMVKMVYDYARDEARRMFFDGRDVDFTNATEDGEEVYKENAIVGAIKADLPVAEYKFSEEYPEKYKFFKDNGLYENYAAADEEGKRAYSWAYDNPGKYTMSKAVADDFLTFYRYRGELFDLEGEKDEDGKTISGSKKEKVIAYINEMDLDYGQKIILFRSMYSSKEDRNNYNADIIEYLNSREDISYEDMVTILEELGMKVNGNNVTWD